MARTDTGSRTATDMARTDTYSRTATGMARTDTYSRTATGMARTDTNGWQRACRTNCDMQDGIGRIRHMCGRFYVSEAELDDFAALIDGIDKDLLKPRPNRASDTDIVPGDFAPVLVSMPETKHLDGIAGLPVLSVPVGIRVFSWGFPSPQGKGRIINTRAESVTEKPLFRLPFASHRCLVPARGFYEWSDANESDESPLPAAEDEPLQMSMEGLFSVSPPSAKSPAGRQTDSHKRKQPRIRHRFYRTDGRMLLMAGIYWNFRLSVSESVIAFTILTTAANSDVSPVHDRMPLLLEEKERNMWLGAARIETLLPLLVPPRDGTLCRERMQSGS